MYGELQVSWYITGIHCYGQNKQEGTLESALMKNGLDLFWQDYVLNSNPDQIQGQTE